MTAERRRSVNGFRHPWAFWLGVAGVTAGVALHVPMFLGAKDDHYMLSGMPWDRWMVVGMTVMLVGYGLVLYGLSPRFSRGAARQTSELEFEGLDEGKLTAAHVKLMIVLTLGVAIDTQKPFTFTFILPGVANEYNLRSPAHPAPGHWPVALFPFVAIVGTVLGSLLWGLLGDSIGRRAAILLASTLFIGTAMCSAMPAFHWNLVACFFMGLSAGGLLPIVYALLAETIPKRRRGEAIVLVAGIGTALGFLFASWTAHWLIPEFGWRIMWFFGVPTGLALILLNRFIPESPRFLLANGHADEAHEVMRSFGVTVVERPAGEVAPAAPAGARPGIRERLPPSLSGDHAGADPVRAGLGPRELRRPRLAPDVRREERRLCRSGDDDSREGGAVRNPRLGRRRMAVRPVEQPRHIDPRSRARGRRARRLRRRR